VTIAIKNPELEALIQERLQTGTFEDVEDILLAALKLVPTSTLRPPKKNFTQFLLESPLRNSGLNLERQVDYPRPAEL